MVWKDKEISKTVPGFAVVQINLLIEGKEQQYIRILCSACMHRCDCIQVPISLTTSCLKYIFIESWNSLGGKDLEIV